jgi:hypothetical protein
MTTPLSYEELELACRLLHDFVDKRDLTSGHEWQAFAPIKRRTWHGRLVRHDVAILQPAKYGVVLLRRGARWDEIVLPWVHERRDREVMLRLEIRAWADRLLPKAMASVDPCPQRTVILLRRDGSTPSMNAAKVVPFRSRIDIPKEQPNSNEG